MISKKYLFLIFGTFFVGLVLSPSIYAAVAPHITITMDLGQIEKPFQIKDNSDNDVFTVDTNGHVSPEHEWREFTYYTDSSSNGLVSFNNSTAKYGDLPTGKTTTGPNVLALWTITPPPEFDNFTGSADLDYYLHNHYSPIQAKMRSNDASYCVMQLESFAQSSGWNWIRDATVSGNTNWQLDDDRWYGDRRYGVEAIRVSVYTDDNNDQGCDIDWGYASYVAFIPDDWTVTRIK